MKKTCRKFEISGRYRLIIPVLLFFLLISHEIIAQEPPPRPLEVNLVQDMGFGAFTHGLVGGTISVDPSGVRSVTGDVILLNLGYTFSAAIFNLVAIPGTVITIMFGADVSLPGSNGGSMTLHIGQSDPVSPFVMNTMPPSATQLKVGGTLTVGNTAANPPGSYSGTFDITFMQE